MTGWPNESSVTLWLNVILTPRIKERRFLRQSRSSLSSKYSYRRYFDGTNGEDFQLLRRVARFYSAASLSRDIYLSRDFAVVITFVIDPLTP